MFNKSLKNRKFQYNWKMLLIIFIFLLVLNTIFNGFYAAADAAARYSTDNDNVFWFVQISDIHMGERGEQDSGNLDWIVRGEGKQTINPEFIVATGDLTDCTDGLISDPCNDLFKAGPYVAEWREYLNVLGLCSNEDCSEINDEVLDEYNGFYYDIPGNHDHYLDANFDFYLNWSVRGLLTPDSAPVEERTQPSWPVNKPFGTYRFIGVNTAGDDGDGWDLNEWNNYGDHAGLRGENPNGRPNELAYIENELRNNPADLTIIFGHHPIRENYTGVTDTGFEYGAEEFIDLLRDYGIFEYGFGHTHEYSEAFFSEDPNWNGVFYLNVASLGKSDGNHYNIIAIDNDGISSVAADIGRWPVVLITTPLDKNLEGANGTNPCAYPVPKTESNPIRALVFDRNPVTNVQYRIDGGDPNPMVQVQSPNPNSPYLWETTTWDTTSLSPGDHILRVEVPGTSRFDEITVEVKPITNIDAALIIDSSGSMSWNDPQNLRKEASKTFVDTAKDDDQIAIIDFDSYSYAPWPLQLLTVNRNGIKSAIDSINSSGGTNISSGLLTAYDELDSSSQPYKKAAVLLTDGQGYYNNEANLYKVKGWPIYTIGLGSSTNPTLLQNIADTSGGKYFQLTSSSQLVAIYFEIATEIAGGEVISETSTQLEQGSLWETFVNIPPLQDIVNFLTNWPGSEVDMTLVTPSGVEITPSTQDPNIYHAKGLTYELYRINNPEAGEWTVQLYGIEFPPGGETVNVSVSVIGPEVIPGDLDGDGDVDRDDLTILMSYRNQPASNCYECDIDGDGTITVLDSRKLMLLCTRPRCATQ